MKRITKMLDIHREALPKAFIILEMMLGFDCLARGLDYQYESSVIKNWHLTQAILPRNIWGALLIITGLTIFLGMFTHRPKITATAHFTAFIVYLILAIFVIHQGLSSDIHRLRTLFDMTCVSLANLIFYIIKITIIKQKAVEQKKLNTQVMQDFIQDAIRKT